MGNKGLMRQAKCPMLASFPSASVWVLCCRYQPLKPVGPSHTSTTSLLQLIMIADLLAVQSAAICASIRLSSSIGVVHKLLA